MPKMPFSGLVCQAAVALTLLAGRAAAADSARPVFITLGTNGGPVSNPDRSEPANAILVGRDAYVVDAGDGTAQQLARAGIRLPQVKALFLSHLHFDHTGGLGAILGLRYQTNTPGKLAIYGPPGTKALVDGIIASMQPGAAAGYGLPGAGDTTRPADTVTVTELSGGDSLMVGPFTVRTAQNSHYSFAPGSDLDRRFKSLSYRFETPDRVIAYTGDTGPSPAVEALAKGADLLVSEMIDLPATFESVRRNMPDMSEGMKAGMVTHLTSHHLTPEQVGLLARAAGVKSLAVTHLAGGLTAPDSIKRYEAGIHANYSGPVTIATDLQHF